MVEQPVMTMAERWETVARLELEQKERQRQRVLRDIKNTEVFQMLNHASDGLFKTVENLKENIVLSANNERTEYIDLSEYVDKSVKAINAQILLLGVSVETEFCESNIIKGIPAYIDSILINLLSNAIKYRSSNRKLKISISTTDDENSVFMKISDNGLGIDLKKYGNKVFGLNNTFHSNSDANGKGLYITKSQIEALGGTITLESVPDKGTTFYLSFPK